MLRGHVEVMQHGRYHPRDMFAQSFITAPLGEVGEVIRTTQ